MISLTYNAMCYIFLGLIKLLEVKYFEGFVIACIYIYIYIYIYIDNAVKITREIHYPIARKSHLHNKKKRDLTESVGVVPIEYTPKVKLELFSQL